MGGSAVAKTPLAPRCGGAQEILGPHDNIVQKTKKCIAIKERYIDILKALSKLILESTKKDERNQAHILKIKMENFEFIFIIIFVIKILSPINIISKILQSINIDLVKASTLLKSALFEIKQFRNDFECVLSEARTIAQIWGVKTEFACNRTKITKKHFDELSVDHRFSNHSEMFKINVFLGLLILSHVK